MAGTLPLLAAAALVGALHMSAPDHWVTLCILGQRASWSRAKLAGLGVATAAGHVFLSVLLGFGVVFLGVEFSQGLSRVVSQVTGVVMVVVGTGYAASRLLLNVENDYSREADQEIAAASSKGRGLAYFVVLGGALSPDLSILPVFLLATPLGIDVVFDAALVFAAASVLSLSLFLFIGSTGLSTALSKVPPKYNDALVGAVIAAVGAYVLFVG